MRIKQSKIILNLMLMSFLISLLPVSCVHAGSATGAYGIAVIDGKNADKVHLRAFASQDSESLGLYFTGTQVLCESDPSEDWTAVSIGSEFGYIKSEYLSFNYEKDFLYKPMGSLTGKNGKSVNIYLEPSKRASISGTARTGDNVIIQGETKTRWYYVSVNNQFGYVPVSSVSIYKKQISANTQAYEKELLTTDFKATGRAFYALARVNAKNATGTYLWEFVNGESRTLGFINNGCLLKCLYPPENGWVDVELFIIGGMVNEKDLSFDIGAVKPVANRYRAVRDVGISYAPMDIDPIAPDVLHAGQQCTVLYLSWPAMDTCQHYYMIETDDREGYVPIDSIEKIAN